MLGSVSPHSRKNGTYLFTFKHSNNPDHIIKRFTIENYGTAAKAKAAAEAYRKKIQPDLKKLSSIRTGTSYVDKLYKDSKAFQDFTKDYAKNTNKPEVAKNFYKLDSKDKININESYQSYLKKPGKKGLIQQ